MVGGGGVGVRAWGGGAGEVDGGREALWLPGKRDGCGLAVVSVSVSVCLFVCLCVYMCVCRCTGMCWCVYVLTCVCVCVFSR